MKSIFNLRKDTQKFILFVILSLAVLLVVFYLDIEDFSPEAIISWVESHEVLAPLVYIAIFTFAAATLLPGTPVAMAGGVLFGWPLGVLYTVVGAIIGASITFFFARLLGEKFVERFIKEKDMKRFEHYKSFIEEKGFYATAFFRLVPLIPFTILSMITGLSKVKFSSFFWGTLLGIIPGTFAYVYFGQSLFLLSPIKMAIALAILALLSSLVFFLKKGAGLNSNGK